MNTKYTTLESSAMSYQDKMQSLSQEVFRRLARMDDSRNQEEKDEVLNKYSEKIVRSGYNVTQARAIMLSGIRCFYKKISEHKMQGLSRNRNMMCPRSRLKRIIKHKSDKTMWYKTDPNKQGEHQTRREYDKRQKKSVNNKPDLRKTVTVINILRTHDGNMARMISEAERKLRAICSTKVKVIESVGPTLKSMLVRSNPWANLNCPRDNCLPCNSTENKKFNCTRRSITYMSECKLCKDLGCRTVYIGESSNSLSERAGQHIKDAEDPQKESHMQRHISEEHPGVNPADTFSIKQITPYVSAFRRQLEEAYLIKSFKGGVLLNTKFEYNHNILPSLTTNDPRISKDDTSMPIHKYEKEICREIYAENKRIKIREIEENEAEHNPNKRRRMKRSTISTNVQKNKRKHEDDNMKNNKRRDFKNIELNNPEA